MISNSNVNFIDTDEVLLNGTIVAKGAVSVASNSTLTQDEFGRPHQDIYIEGILETGYYMMSLDTIETNRYYIEGVFVDKERFGSSDNKILYDFHAKSFQVKFQDTNDKFYEVKLDGGNNSR